MRICPACKCRINENPCDCDTAPSERTAECPSDAPVGSGSSAHDKAWEKNFVVPIARTMKERGIGYMVICLQENGKAAYVLESTPPDSELVEYLITPQNA